MEWLAFVAGLMIGVFVTVEIKTYQTKKVLLKRGDALRAITMHKWNTGLHNDAVVITNIAMNGLKHD